MLPPTSGLITNDYAELTKKYPEIKGAMTVEEHDALSAQAKTDMKETLNNAEDEQRESEALGVFCYGRVNASP